MVRQRRSSFSRRAPALLVIAALAFAGLLSAETMNPSTAAASPVTSASPKPTTTAQKSAAVGPTAVDDSVTVGYPAIIKLAGPSNDKAGSSPIVPSLTVFPTDGQTRGTTIKDGGHTIEVANHGAFNIGNGAPNANFETWVGRTGTVSVRYRITDANGLTADGLLTVVVTAGGAYDNVDAYQGTTVTGVDVLTNDTPGRNADGTAGTLDPGSVRFPHQQYADVTSVSTDGRTATFEDGSGAAFDAQGLLTFTAATASSDEETGGAAFYTARDTTVAADGTVQHHAYQSEVRLYGDVNHVVLADDHGATPFDASLVVPYLANDTDTNPAYRLRPDLTTFTNDPGPGGYLAPDKRKLRYAGGGTWIINPDGTVLYIPVRGAAGVGKDDATVTVYDDHGHSAAEDLEVNVEPGPEAHRDRPSTPQNVATTIAVLANDEPGTSADGTPGSMDSTSVRFPTDGQLRRAIVSSDHRTLTVYGEGSYTIDRVTGAISFKPSFGFTGTAQPVTYTAHDTVRRTDGRLVHNGVTSTLSVSVTPVTPVAARPTRATSRNR